MAHDARAVVIVANSLLTYRDVISAALEDLRPHLRVLGVEPGELDRELSRLAPDSAVLVVCSRVTPAVESRATAWVELYPGHGSGAVVGRGGEMTAYPEMDFDALLSVVDDAGRLYETA